ncbi:MAG: PDZ domain-containing protein [Candidatus Cloacimonetes bacterium]|nr:PDZ domain-containing protein [Candidatus Cloacimonadota bacterium]
MKKYFVLIILIFIINLAFASNLNKDVINELTSNQIISGDSLFTILSDWQNYSQPQKTGVFLLEHNQVNDTLAAPYVVYIPNGYNAKSKTPLIIYLHGGVSTKVFHDTPIEYAEQNYFTEYAEKNNWIVVYPMGNNDTAWWNLVGINNINAQIRELKSQYNIDDNRIYITGFSDGGSGSFHFALNAPDDFAAFYPLNGMLSVGSIVTQIPVYLPNLKNRSVYAVNTDDDGLYPAKKMRELMELSLKADANLFYKEYWGIGHTFEYASSELPILIDNMKTKVRDIFPPEIYWETSMLEYGKCDWLQITEIDTMQTHKEWQKEYNVKLTDERVSFGFYNDREYKGIGAKITKIMPESAAEAMGLEENDIIIKMDDVEAENIGKLIELRSTKKRGDEFTLTILRADDEVVLNGLFPNASSYNALSYEKSSGAVKANYFGNHFNIETSRVSQIAIYIHPKMINMKIPIIITLNGNEVFNEIVQIDREFMVKNLLENHDRKALWTNKIFLNVNK